MRVNIWISVFASTLSCAVVAPLMLLGQCQLDQPDPIVGPSAVSSCQSYTYSINSVPGADSYVWSIPNGWTGSSTDTFITVIPTTTEGVISVYATSSACDPSFNQFEFITESGEDFANLCFVGVDTVTWDHNLVFWEWPSSNTVDSVFIHYMLSPNVFEHIGSVSRDSLSVFHDIGLGHDPNVSTHAYAISTLDTSGVESCMTNWHSTAHLFIVDSANLQWDKYTINGDTTAAQNYYVHSDSLVGGSFGSPLDLSGSQSEYIDLSWDNTADVAYHLRVALDFVSCGISRTNVLTPASNLDSALVVNPVGLETEKPWQTRIYPNPASNYFSVESASGNILHTALRDDVGRLLKRWDFDEPASKVDIDLGIIPSGVYLLEVQADQLSNTHRLLIR